MRLRLFHLALGLLVASTAWAEGDIAALQDDLVAAEQRLEAALGATEERDALVAALRTYEDGITRVTEAGLALAEEERVLARALVQDSRDVRRMLAALSGIGGAGVPAIHLAGHPPQDVLRAATLLDRAASSVVVRAEKLRTRQAELADLRARQADALEALREGYRALARARSALVREVDVDLTDIGVDTNALATLALALEEQGDPVALDGTAVPPLSIPIKGDIVLSEAEQGGTNGVWISALPGAVVTAPWDASVRFVGELEGYGSVMVLETGPEMLAILSGMGRALVGAGSTVAVGDILGFLPARDVLHEEFSQSERHAGGNTPANALYIEVRMSGRPVDVSGLLRFDE